MKHLLRSLPLVFLTTAAFAHEVQHSHHHMQDPPFLSLAAGFLAISFAIFVSLSRK